MYVPVMLAKELVAASTEPLILSLLSKGESYGYALIQEVKRLSTDEIEWTDGMLYPVLHRLEENIGAVGIELTPEDFRDIDDAASRITVPALRYPEKLEQK
jgi:hypothetical protein